MDSSSEMNPVPDRLFFPVLARQADYPIKASGSFYAYSYYRDHVAEDCLGRCVYCDSHADEVGGPESMQLDHFRPESIEEFKELINDPRNLHYSCSRCNLLKSNHWPALGLEGAHNGRDGFVDPFVDDRLEFFEITRSGEILPIKPPSAYMIRLLRLDREFLRKLRELRQLKARWREKVASLRKRLDEGELVNASEISATLEAVEALLG